MEKIFSSSFEELIGEDVFAGIFSTFMKAIHVELPHKGVNIAMPEVSG